MKKEALFLILSISFLVGCTTSRYSGRYGDGTVYEGIGSARIFRKFYVRKIDGDGGGISSTFMTRAYSDIFTKTVSKENIPVDLYIKSGKMESSGEWSVVFACLYSIIPYWSSHEQSYTIDIVVGDDDKLVPQTSCRFANDFKMSICSPLGLIPYGDKEGYQRNEFASGFSSPDIAAVTSDVMGACIAQQLVKYALDRLTIPDVDFAMEIGGDK